MFEDIQDKDLFSQEAMTYNIEMLGVLPETFQKDDTLNFNYTPITTSTDEESGTKFVSSMEGLQYPIFATHFHPEEVLSNYSSGAVDHSWNSVNYNRYFADRFVSLARQNWDHDSFKCGTFEQCQAIVIENYPLIKTGTELGNIYVF